MVTGKRLKEYTLLGTFDGSGGTGIVFNQGYYTVAQSHYSCRAPALDGGADYVYEAVEYAITQPDGTREILRSRGSGNGTALDYLDIYIDLKGGGSIAILGDPFLYKYDVGADAASRLPALAGVPAASLPTSEPAERASYWFDINGGSDMGGASYRVRTGPLTPLRTVGLGSAAHSIGFSDKWTDAAGDLKELSFVPALLSESRVGIYQTTTFQRFGGTKGVARLERSNQST